MLIELLYKSVTNKEMYSFFQCHLNYSTLSQIAYLNVKHFWFPFSNQDWLRKLLTVDLFFLISSKVNPDQSRSKWFTSLNFQSLSNLFYFRASGSQKCGLAEIAMIQMNNEKQINLPSGRTTSTLSLNDFEWDTSIKVGFFKESESNSYFSHVFLLDT